MLRLAACVLFLLLAGPARALEMAGLERAADYSARHQGKSLLVIDHGKEVFERYANGGSAGEKLKIYSGTKGFWVLAALAAEEAGILSLDEPVAGTIREWRDDARKSQVTLRDLLNFTSGLEPVFHLHSDEVADRNATALAASAVAERGTRFIYGPAALQVFEEVLRRKLAAKHETATQFLERRVLEPLGLGPQIYKTDRAGNPLLASGFRMTAGQWSRMGRLILRGGSPVVSASDLAKCFRGTAANPAFGMGFWNNHEAHSPGAREFDIEDMLELDWPKQDWRGTCICRDAPSDLVAGIGSMYQRLFVIPSMELVIVRQGTGGHFSDGEFLRLLLGR